MEEASFADRFDFPSSIGVLSVAAGIPYSAVVHICDMTTDGDVTADQVVRLLLTKSATKSGKLLSKEDSDALTSQEVESIAATIISERDSRTAQKIDRVVGDANIDTLARFITERGKKTRTSMSQLVAAKTFAGLPLGDLSKIYGASHSIAKLIGATAARPQATPIMSNPLKGVAPPPRKTNGEIAIDKINKRVDEKKSSLTEGRLVSLVAVSAPGNPGFYVTSMEFDDDYIVLDGVEASDGSVAQIIQHYTQLNIMILDVPEKTVIGFT